MFDLCLRPTWRANSSHHYICSSYFSTPQRFCPQKSQVFSSAQSLGHCDLPKRKCVLCQTPLNMCLRFLPSSTIRNIDSQSSQPPLKASWKTQWPKLSSSTNSIMEDTASQSSQLPLISEPCQKVCPRLPILKHSHHGPLCLGVHGDSSLKSLLVYPSKAQVHLPPAQE